MTGGDLTSLLNSNIDVTWERYLLSIAIDVVEALTYLHGLKPVVIHRDLKSRNILLDAYYQAKLSDFGLSRNRSIEETMTVGVGTIRWTAPELIRGDPYDESADIYSFGVVLNELDTRKLPYASAVTNSGSKMTDVQLIHEVLYGNLKLNFSSNCPNDILDVAQRCLKQNPLDRPTAVQVLVRLKRMLHDMVTV
jgi:serine/threonine protein kinase